MRLVIAALLMLIGYAATAQVATSSLWNTSTYTVTSCDQNDKTAAEVRECKLAYWHKMLDEAVKRREEADKDIAKAKERIEAFSKQ